MSCRNPRCDSTKQPPPFEFQVLQRPTFTSAAGNVSAILHTTSSYRRRRRRSTNSTCAAFATALLRGLHEGCMQVQVSVVIRSSQRAVNRELTVAAAGWRAARASYRGRSQCRCNTLKADGLNGRLGPAYLQHPSSLGSCAEGQLGSAYSEHCTPPLQRSRRRTIGHWQSALATHDYGSCSPAGMAASLMQGRPEATAAAVLQDLRGRRGGGGHVRAPLRSHSGHMLKLTTPGACSRCGSQS